MSETPQPDSSNIPAPSNIPTDGRRLAAGSFPETNKIPPPRLTLPPPPNQLLFGRFGLRAGWAIVLFLFVAVILILASNSAAFDVTGQLHALAAARQYAQSHPGSNSIFQIQFTPAFLIVNDGPVFFGLLGFCWLLSRLEPRPLASFGLAKPHRRDFIPGALWGIFIMSALTLFLWSQHLLVFDGRELHGAAILTYGVPWLAGFLLAGLTEEYELRGYLQYTLMRGFWGLAERLAPRNPYPVAFWIAATFTSCLFAALHLTNSGETLPGILQIVFIGLVFCYALYRTGSLWWGVGFHALWDWMQSFVFGVPDSGTVSVGRLFATHPAGKPLLSGGSDGPEGSIFAAVAILLTIFAIRFSTRPGVHPSPGQLPYAGSTLPPTLPPDLSSPAPDSTIA